MLSIGRPKTPEPNNENVLVTPQKEANNLGPLANKQTLNDMFPNPQYRSHVFFIKDHGKIVGIRKVALKKDGDIFKSTLKELKVYNKVKGKTGWHDYVLPFRDGKLLDHGKTVYIDFDYVEGKDLIDYSKSLTMEQKHKILGSVAKALAFCFNAGFTHGDIKADNIYISKAGKVLLFDFGEAIIDPRTIDQRNDLEAYLDLCKALEVYPKISEDLLDLDSRDLDDIYKDLAKYYSDKRGGGTRRRRRRYATRNKRV